MIRHVVTWKLTAEDPEQRRADAEAIALRLAELPPLISEIEHFQVGIDTGPDETNWDVVLIADYASFDALAAYQAHPAHLPVIPFIRERTSARAAVDFEL